MILRRDCRLEKIETMTPIQKIHAERKRQIEVESWTPEHDDCHDSGEMLTAAVIYFQYAIGNELSFRADGAPMGWPWEAQWWKPKDRERNLVRAGALCLAERERIRRRAERFRVSVHSERMKAKNRPLVGHVDQKLALIVDALHAA